MNTWLADAHGKAPAPISAIFSAILLPVSIYPIIRLFEVYHNVLLSEFAFVLGFLSVATASIMTLNQKLYKRLFAYSSIENMGLALIGISLGSYALFGAIILIFTHALAKSGVFMLTGNIFHNFKSKKIEDISGLIKTMPKTGLFLFLGTLAVTGAPPFATFFAELLILAKTINLYGWIIGLILFFFVGCGFLFINYKVINMVFSSKSKPLIKESFFTLIPIIYISLAAIIIIAFPVFYKLLDGVIK
jgi:hydrogenase-4 component F